MRRLLKTTPPPSRRYIRIMRIAAFNALLIAIGLALIAAAGEAYFRLIVVPNGCGLSSNPQDFKGHKSWRFVPNVGLMPQPNLEARFTNHLDFWTITRTNSLGFLDREPISVERAAESCHIAFIGDSFIEAWHVPIADKVQVKLDELAARELPHLDVTTSAFGRRAYGQINQLAFYDEYARRLSPKVVALVFVNNDFDDNSVHLNALGLGMDPDHLPRVTAAQGADGEPELRPPAPDYEAFRLPPPPPNYWAQTSDGDNGDVKSYIGSFAKRASSPAQRANAEIVKYSYFAKWLDAKRKATFPKEETRNPALIYWVDLLSRRPRYSTIAQGWTPITYANMGAIFKKSELPPIFEEAVANTKFGLEQFKRRTKRDGAELVILAVYRTKVDGNLPFDRLTAMAEELGIPVIEQYDYIIGIGADPTEAAFKHNGHWNEDGHRWAAEALLEWLRDNQDACD